MDPAETEDQSPLEIDPTARIPPESPETAWTTDEIRKVSKKLKKPEGQSTVEIDLAVGIPSKKPRKTEDQFQQLNLSGEITTAIQIQNENESVEDCTSGRERLKRYRTEAAGRSWIPEIWGKEEMLEGWVDRSSFDAALIGTGIVSARAALVEESRRASSSRIRVGKSC